MCIFRYSNVCYARFILDLNFTSCFVSNLTFSPYKIHICMYRTVDEIPQLFFLIWAAPIDALTFRNKSRINLLWNLVE